MNKLYIDGENFLFKVAHILKEARLINDKPEITKFKISHLIPIISNNKIDDLRFYAARLHFYNDSQQLAEKSRYLIESRRRLKRYLTNDGVKFVTSGNVRLQKYVPADSEHDEEIVFKEKGVDVRLAIDIITDVYDGKVKTIFLASSDSDMVPVVRAAKRRGARVVYIGFAGQENRGLIATCDDFVLLQKKDIIGAYLASHQDT